MATSGPRTENGKVILVTGGAGYIGSHTVLELVEAGYGVVAIDNLCNSSAQSLQRVNELTGKPDSVQFIRADICNESDLETVFAKCTYHAVIHFAALKAVGESGEKPLAYFHNNVTGTLMLLEMMKKHKCTTIVFSSSATVYGTAPVPYNEASPTGVGIPSCYGHTKAVVEQILQDVHASKADPWKIVLLRYFNPVGAHPSGRIGEDPRGPPNNLMPYIAQVAVGRRECLTVFGDDYDTPDGTCQRDYIHVVDLAKGHVAALKRALSVEEEHWLQAYNLGSGKPVSVLQLLKAMEKAAGKPIPHKVGPRRTGDLPAFWADTGKAREELGWAVEKTAEDMCADTWRWQSGNPNGYEAFV